MFAIEKYLIQQSLSIPPPPETQEGCAVELRITRVEAAAKTSVALEKVSNNRIIYSGHASCQNHIVYFIFC